MSLSEIENSLCNIKMKKHQVHKDQDSNKFCLCAAHMTRGSIASGTTSWRKRDVEHPELSMPDPMNSWDKTSRSLGSKNWPRRHSACTLLKSRGQVWLKKPNKQQAQTETTRAINTCDLGNTSYAYTAFWKSGVYKTICIIVLLTAAPWKLK